MSVNYGLNWFVKSAPCSTASTSTSPSSSSRATSAASGCRPTKGCVCTGGSTRVSRPIVRLLIYNCNASVVERKYSVYQSRWKYFCFQKIFSSTLKKRSSLQIHTYYKTGVIYSCKISSCRIDSGFHNYEIGVVVSFWKQNRKNKATECRTEFGVLGLCLYFYIPTQTMHVKSTLPTHFSMTKFVSTGGRFFDSV
jgi:hypothetical protein